MDTVNGAMWVALGSILGGTARFWLSGFVARRIGETFPWGTVVVNVSGAFLLGILAASAASHGIFAAEKARQFAAIGILGTYTTVSSFSLQTLSLARDGDMIALRDSKNPDVHLRFWPREIEAFIGGARRGEFDHLVRL